MTKTDLEQAKQEITGSAEAITKAQIIELRAISKPHPMLEKCMNIVLALKGFKQLNWNTAKEFLARPSLKVELLQTTEQVLQPADVLRA